jgi:hypothetical protein
MYAFRKPFAAATFADIGGWHFEIDYKIALLIAQVFGYAAVQADRGAGDRRDRPARRAARSWALIGTSWLALVLFALVPAPWNVAACSSTACRWA